MKKPLIKLMALVLIVATSLTILNGLINSDKSWTDKTESTIIMGEIELEKTAPEITYEELQEIIQDEEVDGTVEANLLMYDFNDVVVVKFKPNGNIFTYSPILNNNHSDYQHYSVLEEYSGLYFLVFSKNIENGKMTLKYDSTWFIARYGLLIKSYKVHTYRMSGEFDYPEKAKLEQNAALQVLYNELNHIYVGDVNGHTVKHWKTDTNYKARSINENTADYIVSKASSNDLQSCLDLIASIYNNIGKAINSNNYTLTGSGTLNLKIKTGNKNFIVYEKNIDENNIKNINVDLNTTFTTFNNNFKDMSEQQQYSALFSIINDTK